MTATLPELAQQLLQQRPPQRDKDAWLAWANKDLRQFWEQHVHVERLKGARDVEIFVGRLPSPNPRAWVLVSPGRVEAFYKYQELALELVAQGYAVAFIDHRGQGFSGRESDNPHHGHVQDFKDYVDDFEQFVGWINEFAEDVPKVIVGHSMGGAIASLFLATRDHDIKAAVLSAPMMGINTKPWSFAMAKRLVRFGSVMNRRFHQGKPRYFIGMKNYEALPFVGNDLTNSRARYAWLRSHYETFPFIKLGGPTYQWLTQSFKTIDQLPLAAPFIPTPMLILQAGSDTVVDLAAQRHFVDAMNDRGDQSPTEPLCELTVIEGSKHEIFMETDERRERALHAMLAFFDKHL